jgi:hypothetical protein
VEPDPGTELSVADAVAARVSQDHLNHKKQWDESAKEVLLGDRVLATLHLAGEMGTDQYAWLSGRLTAEDVRKCGLPPYSDDRWVNLVHVVTTRRGRKPQLVRAAIATVLEQEGVTGSAAQIKNSKLPLAVSLAMRERRGLDTESSVYHFARVLLNCVPPDAWTRPWEPSPKSLDDLAAAAVDDARERRVGPAGIELLLRASWYLALNGHLTMPRNDLGPGGDRRMPYELLLEMLASEHGVKQIRQAVSDGRTGVRASAVTESGDIDISGVGAPVELTDTYIREVIAPRSGPPVPPPRNPSDEFLDALAAYRRALHQAVDADAVLASVEDEYGRPLMDSRGLEPDTVADIRGTLRQLIDRADGYERAKRLADVLAAREQDIVQ